MGIGSVDIALIHELKGEIVGKSSLLDNNKPIYFSLEWKVWILFMDKSMPYSFNLSMKYLMTCLWVLMSGVKMITSSIMQLIYSRMSDGNSWSKSFINEVN